MRITIRCINDTINKDSEVEDMHINNQQYSNSYHDAWLTQEQY